MQYVLEFYECLNRNYHNDKIEPVMDALCEMVCTYERHLNFLMSIDIIKSGKSKDNQVSDFMKKLMPLLEKMVTDNNYDNIFQAVKFINETGNICFYFAECLELLYYPQEAFKDNIKEFYNRVRIFCENKYILSKEKYPFLLVDYINELNKCRYLMGRFSTQAEIYAINELACMVVGYTYAHNMPISSVFDMLNYITNNYRSIKDYLTLNNDKDPLNRFLLECNTIELIANTYEGNGKIIK